MLSDARRKLVWAPTIVNPSAPSVATDLATASVLDISCLVTANNFSLGATGENAIDDPALCAEGNDQAPGRITYSAAMDFYRWTTVPEDEAWTTFQDSGIGGFLVMRIGEDYRTAFAAGDELQVYQVITGKPMIQTPDAAGGFEKFRQMFYVQSSGTDERAVAAA